MLLTYLKNIQTFCSGDKTETCFNSDPVFVVIGIANSMNSVETKVPWDKDIKCFPAPSC